MLPTIFYSNRVERLHDALKVALFREDSSLFSQRLVVVPSPAMKQWLRLQLATDPDLGICAGVELCYLDQALDALYLEGAQPPSAMALTLRIEELIREKHASTHGEEWEAVWRYLLVENESSFGKRSTRRLNLLAEQLATLFRQYGLFAPEMVAQWREGWQAELWHMLFPEGSPWSGERLASEKVAALHLFTMSFLPPHTFDLFMQSGVPATFYHLSPCSAFWSDIRSDRESRRIRRFWEKQGAKGLSLEDLDHYLRDRNALLANFGRMGRHMAELLEGWEGETAEQYGMVAGLSSEYWEEADPSLIVEEEGEGSLLQAVQADLLLLRNPHEQEVATVSTDDRSISLHVAASRRREVEILYDNILRAIDGRHSPSEVVVMAPDIMDYKAHIEAVFGAEGSSLDFQIMDVRPEETHKLLQGLLLLWEIAEGRWELSRLLPLFDHPYFQRRWQVDSGEVEQWRRWCMDAGIRWGADRQQRAWLLKRNYCRKPPLDECAGGTWEEGFERLATGLATGEMAISLTEAPLLGKLMGVLRALKEELAPFMESREASVGDWCSQIHQLLDRFYDADSGEWEWLSRELDRVRRAGDQVAGSSFPFASVQSLLKASLTQQTVTIREHHLQAVRFCSMLPLRAIPVKVLALLGMHEGAYPGVNRLQSLNAMVGDERAGYCPTRTDYDRYLFLEALLSARETLLMSYCGWQDGDEIGPSLLVAELMSYLDSGYRVGEALPSEALVQQHPLQRYDERYFRGDRWQTFQGRSYDLAQAFYGESEKSPRFLEEWFREERPNATLPHDEEIEVTVAALDRFARDPLRAFLQDALRLYVPEEEQAAEEEPFSLSPLEKALLRREALQRGVPEVLQDAARRGQLPSGLFGEVAEADLSLSTSEFETHLAALGVRMDDLVEIELVPDVDAVEQDGDRRYLAPAPTIEQGGTKITVTGTIRDVSAEGLVAFAGSKLSDLCRVWPRYLVYTSLESTPFPARDLLLVKDASRKQPLPEARAELGRYLHYYLLNRQEALPFVPEWIEGLLKGKGLPDDLKETFEGSWRKVYSRELHWAFRGEEKVPTVEVLEKWREPWEELFSGMR